MAKTRCLVCKLTNTATELEKHFSPTAAIAFRNTYEKMEEAVASTEPRMELCQRHLDDPASSGREAEDAVERVMRKVDQVRRKPWSKAKAR